MSNSSKKGKENMYTISEIISKIPDGKAADFNYNSHFAEIYFHKIFETYVNVDYNYFILQSTNNIPPPIATFVWVLKISCFNFL